MTSPRVGVCLTGDVHHRGMGGRDQSLAGSAEVELGVDYLRIAGRMRLRPTLFLTGRCVEQDAQTVAGYADLADCQLGGHGYAALTPWAIHFGMLRRLTGSAWFGAADQRRDIARTLAAFNKRLGHSPTVWRTHAYAGDANSPELLRAAGVTVLSDARDLTSLRPVADRSGIILAPINTWPDHENIAHPIGVAGGPGRMSPEEWLTGILRQVEKILDRGGIALLLAHPVCMKLSDDFKTFTRLCEALRDYPSLHLSEH